MLKPFINNGFKADAIVCNPPYIENEKTIDEKTWKQEPHLALLAKPGTMYYEKVLKDYLKIVNDTYVLAFEIGEDLEEPLTELVNRYCKDSKYYFEKDMYDRVRFLYITGKKE
jgi:release factor glutamine methyltransferase